MFRDCSVVEVCSQRQPGICSVKNLSCTIGLRLTVLGSGLGREVAARKEPIFSRCEPGICLSLHSHFIFK